MRLSTRLDVHPEAFLQLVGPFGLLRGLMPLFDPFVVFPLKKSPR